MRFKVRAGQLWRSPDFLKLWAGETVSLLGSQVTNLALPLLVILTLRATALQVTLLNAVPLGALLSGGLQGWIGLRGTLVCGALGTLLSVLWLCDARLRKLRTLPQQVSLIEYEREK